MKTSPRVTIARYSPRRRVARGATITPAIAATMPAAGSHTAISWMPNPYVRSCGSPLMTAAV
jgi:hypothetical protein